MRILVKWYFNELLGYLIMSFTSIPVTANENKSEGIFSYIEKFYIIILCKTATIRKQNDSILKSYGFNEIVCWQRI